MTSTINITNSSLSAVWAFHSCHYAIPAHRDEAAAHVSVGHREAGLVDGLLKDQVDDAFESLLGVDGQVRHLLHQLAELLRRQLVQDAAHLPEELLTGSGSQQGVHEGPGSLS